ncbi:hypothetical protein [Rhodobium gokarnense]|uniref:Nitrogen fixation protein n=1 Tax=Rhodobium gokarnense TaxID=364296 RepID=A0ABT3HEW9_9HYPH|nr:hypothetical protein [Rhodobium gokarnense]MCW2308943.1 hypothetical protein [Rhodobium gokarnense]
MTDARGAAKPEQATIAVEYACPSTQPDVSGARVLGIVEEQDGSPHLTYLAGHRPVDEAVLKLAEPMRPTEVFRFAGTCMSSQCRHFDGADCQLASRIASRLTEVVSSLPACTIRKTCRWHAQEGPDVCLRCPQVTTNFDLEDDAMRDLAGMDPAT